MTPIHDLQSGVPERIVKGCKLEGQNDGNDKNHSTILKAEGAMSPSCLQYGLK